MNLKLYISLVFGFITLLVNAQDNIITATSSKNKLGLNQRLRVTFTINKQGGDNFKSPDFKNFKIVGGPSQSISQSSINGRVSFSQSYSYILQPKIKGELKIESASIEFNGKILKSDPIKIIVLNAVDLPKNPNDPDYIANQNIHLVAEISKSQPYLGEGIYVEYRLYFSNNVGIYDFEITETGEFNGFWNQEIKINRTKVKTGKYNGEQYRYVVLKKSLLIPSKEGNLAIDPIKMNIIVAVPTGRADFFGNPITRQVKKELASSKKRIHVKALPQKNKPENFTGAVGKFSFDVSLSKHTLKANEPSQIKVSVNGKGNLKLFELPNIETSKELEVYQPERIEKVSITSSGLSGNVTDIYTVVPEFKGKFKIPKTSFSYFNPEEKVYQTITTEDLYIDVLEGKSLPNNSAETSITNKKEVKVIGNNFRYIQTSSSFEPISKSDFFKTAFYYILLLLPIISIPVVIFINKKKEEINSDVLGNKLRKADKLAKKYLSESKKRLGNKEAFYEALERALHNYLKAKLGVEASDISRDKITKLLQNKHISKITITSFIDVLNNCDFARYTPITNVQMKEDYDKAKQVITQLDKQL